MPNLGAPEIIIIVVVLVLLLGWKKLPDAARSVGRSMRIFKSEVSEMKNDGQSAASKDTVDGAAVRQQGTTAPPPVQTPPPVHTPPAVHTPQTTTPPAVQENAPRTDNTSGPQNPTGTPGSTSI